MTYVGTTTGHPPHEGQRWPSVIHRKTEISLAPSGKTMAYEVLV